MNRQSVIFSSCTVLCCAIMFAAGLRPEGFRFRNTASWIADQNGIRFGKMGIAFAGKPCLARSPESLSIELALKPPMQRRKHLAVIFNLWDNRGQSHAALCQWDSSLMVMKSPAKYLKNSRLHIGKFASPEKPCFVTITSSRNQGTDLYINGIHASSTRRFDLCDSNGSLGRLILGNSASATNPWRGELYSLSLHGTVFSKENVLERYHQWLSSLTMQDTEASLASYSFDERNGDIARDRSGKMCNITIPALFSIPQKRILSMPWEDFKFTAHYASDVVVNLFGFVPFGFFFSALLWSLGGSARRHKLLATVLAGIAISLLFELAQAYIPTRSSQMSDVVLNVLGTIAGAVMAKRCYVRRAICRPHAVSLKPFVYFVSFVVHFFVRHDEKTIKHGKHETREKTNP
ncbi:MAG: VanZ family protein [Chitinispirillaceae bacterium]|nr:VanZ family protein [Chitinispirillaceae bacterium]